MHVHVNCFNVRSDKCDRWCLAKSCFTSLACVCYLHMVWCCADFIHVSASADLLSGCVWVQIPPPPLDIYTCLSAYDQCFWALEAADIGSEQVAICTQCLHDQLICNNKFGRPCGLAIIFSVATSVIFFSEPGLATCIILVFTPICSWISGKKSFIHVNCDENADCDVEAKTPTRWC